ncbi:MAG: DNA recombination protein RmuC [Sulfurospirillaceae bacterium]|nr:DNA recombination protein RmuC [Sulfurospirillaceae bacterium]
MQNDMMIFIVLALLVLTCSVILFVKISSLDMRALFDKHKDFIYEKMVDNAKSAGEQIEKNAELFLKISTSQERMKEELQKLLFQMNKDILQSVTVSLKEQKEQSSKDFEKLSKEVDIRLQVINEKVEKRLEKGFENIDKTFKDIIVGIAKIGEAQKKIESLSSEVTSLQSVLTDKKSRGIFGEVQLSGILKSIFGERHDMYELQYSFKTGVIADAIIKAPSPLGIISVDSKFPLENYTRMIEDKKFTSDFKQNIKKHVNDIASKYIINGVTADMAILFLPAEAIFAEINAYHEDLIDYARQCKVWIASPTTFMALLTTVTAIVRDIKTQEQAKKIQEELLKLSVNFKRYKERWDSLSKHIDTVNKDVKEITATTHKISSEFERIEKVEFKDEEVLLPPSV